MEGQQEMNLVVSKYKKAQRRFLDYEKRDEIEGIFTLK